MNKYFSFWTNHEQDWTQINNELDGQSVAYNILCKIFTLESGFEDFYYPLQKPVEEKFQSKFWI